MKLKDKVIVVTGSTRGMGRSIARACAVAGAKVVICSRADSSVKATLAVFKEEGLEVSGLVVDVAKENDIAGLLKHAIETWGKVDVWINNAGLSGGYRPLDELSQKEIDDIVAVNFYGTITACRLTIPYFIKRGGGILINMSGKGGSGDASPFLAVYAATKAAVASLTKSLAKEYSGDPISIHLVKPGMVATDFYKDIKISPKQAETSQNLPYILKAIGVPVEAVANLFVQIAAEEPGKSTGKTYSLFRGRRLIRGIGLMIWYRMTGKIK